MSTTSKIFSLVDLKIEAMASEIQNTIYLLILVKGVVLFIQILSLSSSRSAREGAQQAAEDGPLK